MSFDALKKRYSGDTVKNYNKSREGQARWVREHEVVRALLNSSSVKIS